MGVPRGTTPTFMLTFPEDSGIDLTEAVNVYVTFGFGKRTLTKSGDDLVVTERSIGVLLSQDETLAFPVGYVEIQANWSTENGGRFASEVVSYKITKQLLDDVIV